MALMLEISNKDFKAAVVLRGHEVWVSTHDTNGKILALRKEIETTEKNKMKFYN